MRKLSIVPDASQRSHWWKIEWSRFIARRSAQWPESIVVDPVADSKRFMGTMIETTRSDVKRGTGKGLLTDCGDMYRLQFQRYYL